MSVFPESGHSSNLKSTEIRGAFGQKRPTYLDLAQRPVRRLPEAVFEIGPHCHPSQDKLIAKEEYFH